MTDVAVAIGLVSEAMSKMVSTVIGSGSGLIAPPAEGFAVNDLAVVQHGDDGAGQVAASDGGFDGRSNAGRAVGSAAVAGGGQQAAGGNRLKAAKEHATRRPACHAARLCVDRMPVRTGHATPKPQRHGTEVGLLQAIRQSLNLALGVGVPGLRAAATPSRSTSFASSSRFRRINVWPSIW